MIILKKGHLTLTKKLAPKNTTTITTPTHTHTTISVIMIHDSWYRGLCDGTGGGGGGGVNGMSLHLFPPSRLSTNSLP